MTNWDQRFLEQAKTVASWSKDPSKKVGAVIANGKIEVSRGYNGFPSGVDDDSRLENRLIKYEMIVHAEINAIIFAGHAARGCTLYCWPIPPCSRCASIIIQAGIKRVVSPEPDERWKESCELGRFNMEQAGILCEYVPLECVK